VPWPAQDSHLQHQHWSVDIGALELAKLLAQHFKTFLLFAKYS